MTRLLVNDCLTTIPGTRTFWHDLQEWFGMQFVGGDYSELATIADAKARAASLIVRNASWFDVIPASVGLPTISLLQDIFDPGPQREMQERVIAASHLTVFNSQFTASKYQSDPSKHIGRIIPLPVDFSLFEPGNAMGLQQALLLPDNCICWIGASQGAAGQIKGYDALLRIVRHNPDMSFVTVFKDAVPEYAPPNMRMYSRLPHDELVKIIGACRVGLCTSQSETQHLAGIEMGACGLPLVVPPVGTYWARDDMPGAVVGETETEAYTAALRATLKHPGDPQKTREYWQREFSTKVVLEQWAGLIKEVES